MSLHSTRRLALVASRSIGSIVLLVALGGTAGARAEMPAPGAQLLQGRTEAELSKFLGTAPNHCVALDPERRLCAWRGIGNRSPIWDPLAAAAGTSHRVTVVCELPASDAARAKDSCTIYPAASNRGKYRIQANTRKKNRKHRHVRGASITRNIERAREEARIAVQSARTILALTKLAGDVPYQCVGPVGKQRHCSWRLDGRTWGHGTMGAAFDHALDKRLRLRCGFGDDGRIHEECTLRLDD